MPHYVSVAHDPVHRLCHDVVALADDANGISPFRPTSRESSIASFHHFIVDGFDRGGNRVSIAGSRRPKIRQVIIERKQGD
jgi:hypothetical protein